MQRYFAKSILNEDVILKESDIHHIKNVMRMKKGSKIEVVFENQVHICVIQDDFKIKTINTIDNRHSNIPHIILASALIKEQKQDLILQKATELGVNTIIPLILDRCVVKLDTQKFSKKKTRWETICKEASEQSKRNDIPNIMDITSVKELSKIDADIKIVLNTCEKTQNIKNILNNCQNCAKIVIVIGPEGGITDEEINFLIANDYQSATLGNRILRAETAAFYILSVINYHFMR